MLKKFKNIKSKGNVLRLDVYKKKEIFKLCIDCFIFFFWGILIDYIYVFLKRNFFLKCKGFYF